MTIDTPHPHCHARAKARAAIVGAICACIAGAVLASPPAGAATPQYPDLRMQSPSELHLWVFNSGGEPNHVLRFATGVANVGEGAFEIDRIPTLSGIADLVQRIYESPAGFRDEPVGATVIDDSNAYFFPVPIIARYELWTERGYRRAAARQFTRGAPLYARDSVDHCLINSQPVDPDAVDVPGEADPPYTACYPTMTGLSAGWRHRQSWFDLDQWIEFGSQPLPDGNYAVRVIVDPTNRYIESPGKADPARESEVANSAVSYLRIVGGELAGSE